MSFEDTTVRDGILRAVGLDPAELSDGELVARSPIDGAVIGRLMPTSPHEVNAAVDRAAGTFVRWRSVPAPKRGELVRLFGAELRAHKDALAAVVTLETGKILAEAGGEVQEMIDVCDLAVGLSRQLYGKTIASERAGHRMMETWHPLGVVGIISAFNFPVAVWS
jgi:aldehyde dehydrogenase (NAD+)